MALQLFRDMDGRTEQHFLDETTKILITQQYVAIMG